MNIKKSILRGLALYGTSFGAPSGIASEQMSKAIIEMSHNAR